jgi:hypothetical protein
MKPLNRLIVIGVLVVPWPTTAVFADDAGGKTARTPSRDPNTPVDLPVQATYKLDRASLDDPTADYSVGQAQGGELRQRDKKAAFVRINLPEPFENRVEIRTTLPEPPLVAPVPQPPK